MLPNRNSVLYKGMESSMKSKYVNKYKFFSSLLNSRGKWKYTIVSIIIDTYIKSNRTLIIRYRLSDWIFKKPYAVCKREKNGKSVPLK